jgi:CRISPR/Cas system-associated exonuclease Cas4 (RecB family)
MKLKGRIVDYKTVRKMDKYFLPYLSHELQLNIYAAMLEEKGMPISELAIQYISTDGPSRCPACNKMVVPGGEFGYCCPACNRSKKSYHPGVYLVPVRKMDPQAVRELIEARTSTLEACISLGSPPPGEPSWVCSFCRFKENCPDKE